jgi:uncharacterized protein (DUF58 family)
MGGRFHIGAETPVRIHITNRSGRNLSLRIKDEYPPEMILRARREAHLRVEPRGTAEMAYALTPPRRGRFSFGLTAVRYVSRLGLVWREARVGGPQAVKVYPGAARDATLNLCASTSPETSCATSPGARRRGAANSRRASIR